MWPITLSGRLLIVDLVSRYLTNYLIRREPTLDRIPPFTPAPCGAVVLCGIRTPFEILSPCQGKVAHALLTRPPLKHRSSRPKPFQSMSPLDLHVLGTPPAFVLSQDQTLSFNPLFPTPLLGLSAFQAVFSHSELLSLFRVRSVSFSRFSTHCPCGQSAWLSYHLPPLLSRPFLSFFEVFFIVFSKTYSFVLSHKIVRVFGCIWYFFRFTDAI